MGITIHHSEYCLGDDPNAIYQHADGTYYVLGDGNTPSHAYENRRILSDSDVARLLKESKKKKRKRNT